MSYWVFHNVKINKKDGTISVELIDMSVKDEYLGKPVKYKDFYQDRKDVKLSFEQKMALFIHDLLVGEYYINDFDSEYFRLNYENRVVSGRQDIDFIDNYGTEYSQMITEEMERQNTEERLKENEFCDILIKLNKKYEKEINNILEGKTVDGRELKDWQVQEQKEYLKDVFRMYVSKIEIIEEEEEFE